MPELLPESVTPTTAVRCLLYVFAPSSKIGSPVPPADGDNLEHVRYFPHVVKLENRGYLEDAFYLYSPVYRVHYQRAHF